MKRNNIIDSFIIIGTFLFAFYGKHLAINYFDISFPSDFIRFTFSYLWWVIPAILALGILFEFKNILKEVGLNKGFLTGLVFSAIVVFPMFLSSAIAGRIDENLNIGSLIRKTVVAGTMEEFLFRGFLFGILFRKLGWGFIPASISGALIFGLGHIYQGSSLPETTGVFLVTAMGAVWFSWLYIEWNDNLWIPVFLHVLMNLSWILFKVSENALGGFYTNSFRIITIALSIIITIYYHKKRGLKIKRDNLILNMS